MAEKMSIEDEINHLLTLAEDAGATEHERELARVRAEKLMVRHAIDRAVLDDRRGKDARREEIITTWIDLTSDPYSRAQMPGVVRVARALGLQSYYIDNRATRSQLSRAFGKDQPAVKNTPYIRVAIVGFASDAEEAERLVNSLLLQEQLALKAWWGTVPGHRALGRQAGGNARRSFLEYFLYGAADRIADNRRTGAAEAGSGTDIVLFDREAAVRGWLNENMRLRSGRDRRAVSTHGRTAGFAAGTRAATGEREVGQGSRSLPRGR